MKSKRVFWTPEREKFVLENYRVMKLDDIAKQLGCRWTTLKGFLDRKGLSGRLTMEDIWKKRWIDKEKLFSETERAYLAGLIDGDGTISITFSNVNGKRYPHPVIRITQSSLFGKEISRKFGFKIRKIRRKRGKGVDLYLNFECVSWFRSKSILEQIIPFLIIKKPQALLVYRLIQIRGKQRLRNLTWETDEIKWIFWALKGRYMRVKTL